MPAPIAERDRTVSILVTGANGFVGRHAVAAIRARSPDSVIHDAHFELTSPVEVAAAVENARPDTCLHLAAVTAVPDATADPDQAWSVNLAGTLTLARALLRIVPECRLVFASSADAYGASFRARLALDETAPLAPLNTYGATKAAADLALGAMVSDGLRVIRLRPFNHTGPGQRDSFVIAAFARQLALIGAGRTEPVIRVGALDTERDFLDVRDVARAYAACVLDTTLASGTILNIASGKPRRIGDVLEALIRIGGFAARVETDPSRIRPIDIPRAVGSAATAENLLGWRPRIDWERTLSDVMQDWRERVQADR